jgi:hypothetical protein
MKREPTISLFVATLAFTLLSPQFAHARAIENSQGSLSNANPPAGQHEAMQMVPAQADLIKPLDARKAQPGMQFRVVLSNTIHLKNGTELPHGTALIGLVSTDDMHLSGTSKLALRFTKAELRNGKVLPIKATIVGVFPPAEQGAEEYPVAPGDQDTNSWTNQMLQVDQIGALSGVDLHSKIASMNSGVFVSTKKHDVKLSAGSEFALAIAAQKNG